MDALKKGIIYICIASLIFCAWYYLGGRADVHSDGARIDGALDDLRAAGQQATEAAGNIGSAEESVDEASRTTDEIERGNQQLEEIGGDLADIIDQGKRIIAEIRSRSKEHTEAN